MEGTPLGYFLHRAPSPTCYPPAGAIGATLGTAMNNLYSSPREGLYALHNFTVLLQLDLEKKFEICKVLALGGPPLGPPWWQHVPYEHLWIPGPWGWFLSRLVKIQPCISSRSRCNSYFLHRAPSPTCYPPHGTIGATLGSATNNLYSSPKKVSTLYTTWLFYLNWIWRRKFEICKVLALGGPPPWAPMGGNMYHMITFESPAPKDDSCHVWLKSNHAFSKRRWNSYFFTKGPQGPPWELPWTTLILHLIRYLHTT